MAVLKHKDDCPDSRLAILDYAYLLKATGKYRLGICLLLLLCDFEDDIEFDRHAEGKAGSADYQSNRCLLDPKDIAKEVRDSVRDSGVVEEVSGSCDENSEAHDASDPVE